MKSMISSKTLARAHKQRGISVTVFLVFIALAVMAAAFIAAMNRGPATNTSGQQDQLSAGAIMGQGAAIATGYAFAIGSGITPANVTFDDSATTGLFNSVKNWAVKPTMSEKACSAITGGACAWTLKKDVIVTNVGTGSADVILAVTGLKAGVCEQIHAELYPSETRDTLGTNIPVSGIAGSAIVGAGGDLGLSTGAGRPEGCVKNGTTDFTYYKVLTPV